MSAPDDERQWIDKLFDKLAARPTHEHIMAVIVLLVLIALAFGL